MSKRLTNQLKDQILDNAIRKAGITKRREDHSIALATLAERVRINALGGPEATKKIESAVRRIQKQLSEFPESVINSDVFRKDHEITFIAGGERRWLSFSNKSNNHKNRAYRATPRDRVYRITPRTHALSGDHPLVDALRLLDTLDEQIDNDEMSLRSEIRAVLNSVTTTKRLLEEWPEAAELLPKNIEQKTNLPAVRLDVLNDKLRLNH